MSAGDYPLIALWLLRLVNKASYFQLIQWFSLACMHVFPFSPFRRSLLPPAAFLFKKKKKKKKKKLLKHKPTQVFPDSSSKVHAQI